MTHWSLEAKKEEIMTIFILPILLALWFSWLIEIQRDP